MAELIVLALVFIAVSWCVWVITPILAQAGMQRSASSYVTTVDDANVNSVLRRFTTRERLIQSCWSGAILGVGISGAVMIAIDMKSIPFIGIACAGAGLLSYQIPRVWLRSRIARRQAAFDARLVDLTLGLANGLRAGAALPQSLELVSRDIGGPMTEEFQLVLQEYRLGMELSESLVRLCERMPSEDLTLLVTSVRLTMTSGGSLAEVLDRITDTIRHRTEFHERLQTMTAQGRFEAMAMGGAPILTFLILYAIDPALMSPLVTTQGGWVALAVVGVMETLGFLWINRIVKIDV